MADKATVFDRIQSVTETFLTRRNAKRRIKKGAQKKKNPVLDWVEAFLWAAAVVLLINQYLFQAYQIPSGSMIDTLLIGDRVFVNKIVYGPELLPGVGKLPSPVKPKRNDIIIFENPSYLSRGPVFDIAQRIIYMLTLSLVDIDKDESGDPKVHFLIKRSVGMGGDHFVSKNGDLEVRFAGEDRWVTETDFIRERGWDHNITRLMKAEDYPALTAAGKASAYVDIGFTPPEYLLNQASPVQSLRYPDYLTHERARLELIRSAMPQDGRYTALLARHRQGWYIPEGRVFPLGDNRDNSRDGRYFGPVQEAKVLGQGAVIYWPLGRMGVMR